MNLSSPNAQPTYVDQKLGFSLQLPADWVATPRPGRAKNASSSVIFTNPVLAGTVIQIGVIRSPTASVDFAQRGKPTWHIGSYPAFKADTSAGKQMPVSCLVRIMLVQNDTVIATWRAEDAFSHIDEFESILATYRDHSIISNVKNMITQNALVNPVLSCSQVMQQPGPNMWGSLPSNDPSFGQQIVNPTDSTWTDHFGEGVAVCNDNNWENSYLFQCVELANRFINEEWGLSEFTVDAFAYYDNYQGGTFYQGQARTLFGSHVQLTDDASQGNNSAPPVPGDLLIFQDVNDGSHWTSGEIAGDPGHVAVVTSVTSSQVTVVQQNWQNGEVHSFPLQRLNNGYHIVDNSGRTGRITRGWIHFSANGGLSQDKAFGPVGTNPDGRLEDFSLGTDGNIYHIWQTSAGGSWTGNWAAMPTNTVLFISEPMVGISPDGRFDVIALGSDGNVYHIWQTIAGSDWIASWNAYPTPPISLTGTPSIIANADGRLEIFILGTDKNVYHIWQTVAGGDWATSWGITRTQTNKTNPASFIGNSSVAVQPGGELEVFALGTDGNIYHIWQSSAGSSLISNWVVMPTNSVPFTGSPVVATNADGRFEVFVRGTDNNIYHYWQVKAGGDWATNWAELPTKSNISSTIQFVGDLSIVNQPGGELEAFALGTDGNIYHIWQSSAGGSWIGNWVKLSGNPVQFSKSPDAATNINGKFQVFGLGTNESMYTVEQTVAGGDWQASWTQFPTGSFQ